MPDVMRTLVPAMLMPLDASDEGSRGVAHEEQSERFQIEREFAPAEETEKHERLGRGREQHLHREKPPITRLCEHFAHADFQGFTLLRSAFRSR